MDRRMWLRVALVAIPVMVAAATWMVHHGASAPHPTPAPAPRVTAVPAEISLLGTIQATRIVNVSPTIDGSIEQFLADVGEDVSKGEVLARIKNPKRAAAQEKAQLETEHARLRVSDLDPALKAAQLEISRSDADATRAKLEFEQSAKNYERQQLLMREGIIPRLTFEKAEHDYNALKGQAQDFSDRAKRAAEHVDQLTRDLAEARATLEKSTSQLEEAQAGIDAGEVTSPVDGVVIARRGAEGTSISRAVKDFFRIAVDLDTLQVVAVPSTVAPSRIRVGQPATLQIIEYPGAAQGKVREANDSHVIIDFASPSPSVRPGMTAHVKIKLT